MSLLIERKVACAEEELRRDDLGSLDERECRIGVHLGWYLNHSRRVVYF
jgi:hypothetical protein